MADRGTVKVRMHGFSVIEELGGHVVSPSVHSDDPEVTLEIHTPRRREVELTVRNEQIVLKDKGGTEQLIKIDVLPDRLVVRNRDGITILQVLSPVTV